ncbi:MAG TPA: hypothetical protein VJR29_00570 [bacterium]|nr:hypothetical protein [bacterium]
MASIVILLRHLESEKIHHFGRFQPNPKEVRFRKADPWFFGFSSSPQRRVLHEKTNATQNKRMVKMKTNIKAFLVLCGVVLAAATLAPTKPINPPPPSGSGPYIYDCPLRESPFDYSSARMYRTYCLISCYYEDGSYGNILKPAPNGMCETTESGAIYN